MSDYTTVLNRQLNLEQQFALFLAGTITIGDLTETQRRTFIEGIFSNGVILSAEDPEAKTGDRVFCEGFESVNSGNFCICEMLTDGPLIKTGVGAAQENVEVKIKLG